MKMALYKIDLEFSGSFAAWTQRCSQCLSEAPDVDFEVSDLNAEEDFEMYLADLGLEESGFEFVLKSVDSPGRYNPAKSERLGWMVYEQGARVTYAASVEAPHTDALVAALTNAFRMVSVQGCGDGLNAHDDLPQVLVTHLTKAQ